MSGIDEQPVFPECPDCEENGTTHARWWTLGRLEGDYEDDDVFEELVYLDRALKETTCAKTGEQKSTRVVISYSANTFVDNDAKTLDFTLSKVDILVCSQGHRYHIRREGLYRSVLNTIEREYRIGGVKYE